MKPTKLKCIACGRRAVVVLHGTSYCQEHAYQGVNKPSIPTTHTSPLEIERRMREKDLGLSVQSAQDMLRNHAQRNIDRHSFDLVFNIPRRSGKKLRSHEQRVRAQRRNARRRALRKKRARAKVRSSAP